MGQIRITGGSHRSRKITVEDQPGLRPTGDRIRETLFNWIGHNLSGQNVLDLYTGSGILAFEAASRSAEMVTCVDNNKKTIIQLQKNINALQFEQITVNHQAASTFIKNSNETFDLVFLDPPFDSDEIYTISGIISPMDNMLWSLKKNKNAGQVHFELWQKK